MHSFSFSIFGVRLVLFLFCSSFLFFIFFGGGLNNIWCDVELWVCICFFWQVCTACAKCWKCLQRLRQAVATAAATAKAAALVQNAQRLQVRHHHRTSPAPTSHFTATQRRLIIIITQAASGPAPTRPASRLFSRPQYVLHARLLFINNTKFIKRNNAVTRLQRRWRSR